MEKKTGNGLVSCVSIKKLFLPNGVHANVSLLASVCRQGIQSDAQWLKTNLGGFARFRKYSELKVFNLSVVSHRFHYKSILIIAAQYSELGKSAHRSGFAMSKRKAFCVSSVCVIRRQLWSPSHQTRRLS